MGGDGGHGGLLLSLGEPHLDHHATLLGLLVLLADHVEVQVFKAALQDAERALDLNVTGFGNDLD